MFCKKITIPIYNKSLKVYIDDSIKTLKTKLEWEYSCDIDCSDWSDGISFSINDEFVIGFIYTGLTIPIIVHECSHVALDIISSLNIKDDEAFCYLLEEIVQQVCTILSIPMEVTKLLSKPEVMQ